MTDPRRGPAPDPAPGPAAAPPVRAMVDEPSGLARWWAGLGRGQRAAVAVVAFVLVLALAGSAVGGLIGGTPGGPVSSSFSTGAGGLQGWSELLRDRGHPVVRLRDELGDASLDPSGTVVVADPDGLDDDDARALAGFVADGGRLVVAGASAGPLLGALVGEPIFDAGRAGPLVPWVPVPETAGVTELAGGLGGSFATPPPLVGVLGDDDGRAAVAVADLGRGRLVAVADASLFQNGNLDRADNATFALAVVGPGERPVTFVESLHGFGPTGLDALPAGWKAAGIGLVVALLAGLWAAATRFGPPEPAERTLRPPRRDHVDAVAADLERVVQGEADRVAPLVAATRASLARRVGERPDAAPAVLRAGADHIGVHPDDVTVLVEPVADRAHALAVGALAAAQQRAALGRADPPPTATVPDDPRTPGASP